jgi:lipoprotein NlpD
MAQIDKVQEQTQPEATTVAKEETISKPEATDSQAADTATGDTADEGDEDALDWGLPAQGKLIGQFSESANRKGIDIAGKLGQPVLASAPGKVVYSGSGLRGYGKLIIIKHNKTYLSAYAHNDKVLVKEGQSVTRGQKIAEMGNTDANQVELHFEVRRFGKPVDPAKYLQLGKS